MFHHLLVLYNTRRKKCALARNVYVAVGNRARRGNAASGILFDVDY